VNKAMADGRTALIMAANGGHLALVAALLDAGAKVNRSPTPLRVAAQRGHLAEWQW
jgi:ankyrin repeat protein